MLRHADQRGDDALYGDQETKAIKKKRPYDQNKLPKTEILRPGIGWHWTNWGLGYVYSVGPHGDTPIRSKWNHSGAPSRAR